MVRQRDERVMPSVSPQVAVDGRTLLPYKSGCTLANGPHRAGAGDPLDSCLI